MSSPSTTERTGAGRLRSTWLAAPVPEGLVLVGEQHALDVPLPGEAEAAERAIPVLAAGAAAPELAAAAGIESGEATELLERLGEYDALASEAEPEREASAPATGPPIQPLAAAILGDAAPAADGPWRLIATAEELVAVPVELEPALLDILLRDLVAGIRPVQRRRAYCFCLAARRPTLYGDLPAPEPADAALARLAERDPAAIHLFDLRSGGELSLEPERVGRLGAGAEHRLGTVLRQGLLDASVVPEHLGIHVGIADYALPDVSVPEYEGLILQSRGSGPDPDTALLIARAEAAERFGGGDRTAVELVHAAAADLEGEVLEPQVLAAENGRQRERDPVLRRRAEFDPGTVRHWVRAEPLTADAEPAWAPAEAVLCPWIDPGGPRRILVGSSNGLAAGPDLETATESALRELVERDAFVWTWVQRLSRELIDPASLPSDLREGVEALAGLGFEAAFVNLTLETHPVILCVVHAPGTMTVGAGCAADPARAARSALDEAAVTRLGIPSRDQPPAREDVLIPADHEALYRAGDAAAEAAFLLAAPETVALADVAGAGVPLLESVRALDGVGEPLRVDLTTFRTAPFSVVRVIGPGLIPISFGYDGEPLGMPRLARPRRTADGRLVGAEIDLDRAGPLVPHPFA